MHSLSRTRSRISAHSFLLILITFPLSVFLAAQAPLKDGEKEKVTLPGTEEVVVTATRAEARLASVPANVTVIDEQDIANSTAQDIPGLLRTQVGVQVSDVTGNRRTYRVDLRGFGETGQSNTLVLVDGRRINQPDLSGTDWTLIPLERVRRIELIRGGRGSVLYGDNASGGVVNIITKDGEGSADVKATLQAGSYSTFRTSASVGAHSGPVEFFVSGNYARSDGYRTNSRTEGGDIGGNLSVRFGDSASLGISAGYHSDDTGLPGALLGGDLDSGVSRRGAANPRDFANVDDSYVLLRPEVRFGENNVFQVDFSVRRRDSFFFGSFVGGTFEGDTTIDTFAVSPRLVVRESLGTVPSQLTVGVDYSNAEEDIVNTTVFGGRFSSAFNLKKRDFGVYVHEELSPTEGLSISGGYRYDRVTYEFVPSDPSEREFDENVFNLGATYALGQGSFLYASYSRSFRYPLLDEVFNFFANTIDTDLLPQTTGDFEVGFRHFFSDSFYGSANFFWIDGEDEIFFNPTGGPFGFGANENFEGKTRRTGLELQAGVSLGLMTVQGNYSYTDAEVREGQFSGSAVPSVPHHKAGAEAFFDFGEGWLLGVNGSFIGERFLESDWSNSFPRQESYFVLNARLRYRTRRATIHIDFNNILDQEYSEYGVLGGFPTQPAFFPSPEFNVAAGVTVAF